MTCVKTGASLFVQLEHDRQYFSGSNIVHGDVHLISGAAILRFPPRQDHGIEVHDGFLLLPDSAANLLFFSGASYHTLIFPAICVVWKTGALHPLDARIWRHAVMT